jgi:hypothetical protein
MGCAAQQLDGLHEQCGEERTIWVTQEKRNNCPYNPFIDLCSIDNIQVNQEWQKPDLTDHGCERQFTPYLTNIGQTQHENN